MHKANLWTFLKNYSNDICSNEIHIRREASVYYWPLRIFRPPYDPEFIRVDWWRRIESAEILPCGNWNNFKWKSSFFSFLSSPEPEIDLSNFSENLSQWSQNLYLASRNSNGPSYRVWFEFLINGHASLFIFLSK